MDNPSCVMLRPTPALFAISVLITSNAADATAAMALDISGGSTFTERSNYTLGWDFTTDRELLVTALGVWDEGANGLADDHRIGLWRVRAFGNNRLFAETTVTAASTPIASGSSAGQWVFQTLDTPVLIQPGTYVLGAHYPTTADKLREFSARTTATGIKFGKARFPSGQGFRFLNGTSNYSANFGPNMLFIDPAEVVPVSAVPVPPTIALFGGVGLVGLCCLRWRKSAVAKTDLSE